MFLQLQYAFLARSQAPKIPDIHSIWDLGVWAFAMVLVTLQVVLLEELMSAW